MTRNKSVIGFDADDTLWVNEIYYHETEQEFCHILSDFASKEVLSKELFKTEIQNLPLYGYGTKGFILSMVETALRISNEKVSQGILCRIIELGKLMMNKPIELLAGVKEVIEYLSEKGYKMIVVTKGDLLDQQRKLIQSGISSYFDHIEIMSNKTESDYLMLLKHLKIKADNFIMVGNSLKSDIIPAINIGAKAVHIPFHTTWQHEQVSKEDVPGTYKTLNNIKELIKVLE